MPRRPRVAALLALLLVGALARVGAAQTVTAPAPTAQAPVVERSVETATLTVANRPIVTLRARVLGRSPAERITAARHLLDDLLERNLPGPVTLRPIEGAIIIEVAGHNAFAITSADVDDLAGQTVSGTAAETSARLAQALAEAAEGRSAARLLRAVPIAAGGLVVGLLLLWGIARAYGRLAEKLTAIAEHKLAQTGLTNVTELRASRLLEFQRGLLRLAAATLSLVVAYSTLTFVLKRFPYTRPWGESMLGYLLTTAQTLGVGVIQAIPGLFTVALIAIVTRFLARALALWFRAVERGHGRIQWIHPETAQPTRRLVTTLLWVFAAVVAFPYMPGSQTDAFKGASVFLGLMVTFGSSGLVNQIMSGFMITYSRALRPGDFVRIGDVEGTVVHLGVLSTKLRTVRDEEITIPNAVVVSTTTTDYSRIADAVFTATSVTIGYDAPWRQVHALLLSAAERTHGMRREPAPRVLQESLEDFYVRYTLWFCLERQNQRVIVMDALNRHIQDLFNEYGVQIMSPNYLADPAAPKVVPRTHWYAAPARPDNDLTQPPTSSSHGVPMTR